MTEHEQIQEFLRQVSIPSVYSEGVSCKICFVYTPSEEIVKYHAPNCCIQIFDNPEPVDMVLLYPNCGLKHIDEAHDNWTNPPHKSHECQRCGCIWRPADFPTNGVAKTTTVGKDDNFFF